MKPRTFIALSAATVAAVAIAGFSTGTNNGYQAPQGTGEKFYPRLLADINNVRTVAIKHPDGALTIERYPDRWGMAERGGYAVRGDAVRKLLLAMANLEQNEAKTRLKERHALLKLRAPSEEGAQSKEITLKDNDGAVLSSLIVGKSDFSLEGRRGIYLRKSGDDQSWFSNGAFDVGTRASDWLETEIVNIPPKRVARVVIRHPKGESFAVSKMSPGDAHYAVEGLPANAALKSESAADTLASALDGLELDDAAKADGIDFAADKTVRAEILTFDGLTVNVDIIESGGRNWIKLSANPAEPEKPATPDDKQESGAAKEAKDINARTSGWAYQVAAYKVADLKKHLMNLIKAEPDS